MPGNWINEEELGLEKQTKRVTVLKALCSLCLAKDIKLSSFLGDNPSRNFYF